MKTTNSNLETLKHQRSDISYWRALNPELEVSETLDLSESVALSYDTSQRRFNLEDMKVDGFFAASSLFSEERVKKLVTAVTRLQQNNIDVLYALVYDDFWKILQELSEYVTSILGEGYSIVPCPTVVVANSIGAPPHRDIHDPPKVRNCLPDFMGIWISLTDAEADGSCLHFLPAQYDKNFPDNLFSIAIDDVQNIRAVPVKVGSAVFFNHSLIHWGGRKSKRHKEPRVAFSFHFEKAGMTSSKKPFVRAGSQLSFEERLGFIGADIVKLTTELYKNMPREEVDLAHSFSESFYGVEFTQEWKDFESDRNARPTALKKTRRVLVCPFDGTSNVPGARFGGTHLVNSKSWGFLQRENIVTLDAASQNSAFYSQAIRNAARESDIACAFGGEHLISYPLIEAQKDKHPDLKVVVFDSQHNSYVYPTLNHQSLFYYTVGELKIETLVVGVRHDLNTAYEDTHLIPHKDIEAQGNETILRRVKEWISASPFYLSLDLSVINGLEFPAVSAPVPGGLSVKDFNYYVTALLQHNPVAVDVVEYNPMLEARGDSSLFLIDDSLRAISDWLTA